MVVCLCKGVSDKKINWLLENGAISLRDVMSSCQAGSDCGACICELKEMVKRSRQRTNLGAAHIAEATTKNG